MTYVNAYIRLRVCVCVRVCNSARCVSLSLYGAPPKNKQSPVSLRRVTVFKGSQTNSLSLSHAEMCTHLMLDFQFHLLVADVLICSTVRSDLLQLPDDKEKASTRVV